MSARSTRGPGGGKVHGRRPPVRRGGGRKAKQSGCAMVAIPAAVLAVISVSIALAPMADRVWTARSVVAWAWHGPLMVALLVASVVLYLAVSLLTTRLAVSPAARPSRGGACVSGIPVSFSPPVAQGVKRPGPVPEPVTVSALRGTAGSGATGGAV